MSTWYVNDEWSGFHTGDDGRLTWIDCRDTSVPFVVSTEDALSAPSVGDLLYAGLSLWPRGAAWGTPDNEAPRSDSIIAGLTSSLLAPFADLYAAAWKLTAESRSATLLDSLEDWERDFGLPDPCVTEPQSEAQRRASLKARVLSMPTITPADIVRLAARIGYVVAIEEPEPFRAGESACGSFNEPSDTALDLQFVIHVRDAPVTQFEAGIGEAGVTRLLDFDHGVLECAIRRIAPGWTYPVFDYGPRRIPFVLVTESGRPIVTNTGRRLVAPALPS